MYSAAVRDPRVLLPLWEGGETSRTHCVALTHDSHAHNVSHTQTRAETLQRVVDHIRSLQDANKELERKIARLPQSGLTIALRPCASVCDDTAAVWCLPQVVALSQS